MRKSKYDGKFPSGHTFGNWTVLTGVVEGSPAALHVRCSCGTEKLMDIYAMVSNRSRSCGCIRKQRVGDKNPNWKGQAGISATVLYANSKTSGLSYDRMTTVAANQNYTCALTGGSLTGSSGATFISNDAGDYWVSNTVAPLVRSVGIQNVGSLASSIVQTTSTNNIFERMGFNPVDGEKS